MLHMADSLLTVQGVVQRNSSLGELLEAESTDLSLPITKDKCLNKLQEGNWETGEMLDLHLKPLTKMGVWWISELNFKPLQVV